MTQVLRALAPGAMVLSMQSVCWGQLAQYEVEVLFKSVGDAHQFFAPADWAGCLRTLERTAPIARRAWTHTSVSWYSTELRCQARAMQSRGYVVTARDVTEMAAVGLDHFAHVPPGVERRTGARLQFLHGKWWLMHDLGLGDEADREEQQTIESLFADVAVGTNLTAQEELDRWANGLYGHHALLPRTQAFLAWTSEHHGRWHRVALFLMRAVSFAYRSADRSADALALMNEASTLVAQHHPGDKALQMAIAGERAPCLEDNGMWLEARDEFIALRDWMLQQEPLPHGNLMRMNYHLAGIANSLGDHEQAEAHADAAERHSQLSTLPNDRVEVAVAHLMRAEARLHRGAPGAPEELRRELERNTPADGGTGAPAFDLAKLAYRSRDAELLDWARDFLARHAQARLQPLQPSRALVDIAASWSLGDREPPRSRALLERAVTRSLSGRDLSVGVQSAFALGRRLAPRQPDAAIWWFKRGANDLQALRQRSRAAADDDMHRATLADHEADLREFIGLLIDEGRFLEARDALRVLREEELHDFTRRSRARAALARADTLALTGQERQFERALQPLVDRMRKEQTLADARAKPAPLETQSVGWLDDPASEVVLDRTQGELHTLLEAISRAEHASGGKAPCRPPALQLPATDCLAPTSTRGPAAGDLPRDHARLQYFVRDERLDILVTTARSLHRHSVPITRTDLHRRVHAWRNALTNPDVDALTGAREFHALMIDPVRSRLAGIRQLHVGLDGSLRYLPMAALHDGRSYLVQRFGIVMDDGIGAGARLAKAREVSRMASREGLPDADIATSAAPDARSPLVGRLASHGRTRGVTSVLARQTPVAVDAGPGAAPFPRDQEATGSLQLAAFGRAAPDALHAALPGVDAELATIAELGRQPRNSLARVRVLRDADFTAGTLSKTLAAAPQVVHIASHFYLAAAEEESSYLLLGDGDRLSLARLAQMPWGQVHLALLSACDSAVGDTSQQGRELSGLAGVLRQAGARNVLASLWPIEDGSTASFMREFYRPWMVIGQPGERRASPREPESRWLTEAQRRWLARHPSGGYAHPYYWAAFVWWGKSGNAAPAGQ
ncbi:MAG: CHAT domain-containing protein [Burkholderiales bacterium]|nr:CHAT domain-containing protein [Burkholderiales bacterium]